MNTKLAQILSILMLGIILMGAACLPGVASASVSAATKPMTASGQPITQPAGPTDPQELEAFLDGLLITEMADKHIPGAVVAVVQDSSLLFAKGYGYADLEKQIPVDPERTLFRIGSISKLFTWTAVMQLVEQGKISLDADVNEYLDFAIPATYPEPIRLRHLMSHTPGFEDKGMGSQTLIAEQLIPLGDYLKTNVPARVYPPGEVTAYSNYGTALAGYIVERVSGIPFNEYIEENIFAPLGMGHSSFRQPLPDSLAADMASGYHYANGHYVAGSFEFHHGAPGGGASATAADIARFMLAHLHNGELDGQRILQEATARQMHSQLFTPDPRLGGLAHGFFQNTVNGQHVISHGGDTVLFHSGLYLIPAYNLGLYISVNGTGGGGMDNAMIKAFFDRYFPETGLSFAQSPAGFSERIAPYLGHYTPARINHTSFEKMGLLFASIGANLGDDNTLLFSMPGLVMRFVEVEPGLLQDVVDPDNQIVYHTSPEGQPILTLDSSSFTESFFKTPWYGANSLHQVIFLGSILFFVGAMIAWPTGYLKRWRKGQSSVSNPWLARLGRWVAALFGLTLIASSLGFLAMFSDILPGFGVPRVYFEFPPILNVLLFLSYVLGVMALVILAFAVLSWLRRFWSLGGRIFYSLLALLALLVTWSLIYWSMLL